MVLCVFDIIYIRTHCLKCTDCDFCIVVDFSYLFISFGVLDNAPRPGPLSFASKQHLTDSPKTVWSSSSELPSWEGNYDSSLLSYCCKWWEVLYCDGPAFCSSVKLGVSSSLSSWRTWSCDICLGWSGQCLLEDPSLACVLGGNGEQLLALSL